MNSIVPTYKHLSESACSYDRPVLKPMKTTLLSWPKRLATLAAILAVTSAQASINGPYTPDANTLHLWHLDEASTPAVDSVTSAGVNLAGVVNSAVLNASSTNGFGTALNTTDGGQNATTAANMNAGLFATTTTTANTSIQLWDPTTGSFTMEAIVKIGFDPSLDYGILNTPSHHVLAGTPKTVEAFQIISGESATTASRLFQWRLNGSNVLGTGIGPAMSFNNLRNNNASQAGAFYAVLPTAGPDAIVSNSWYHVAVTYNGVPNTANNLKFYWTLLDPSRTSANQLTPILTTTVLAPPC